LQGRVDLPDLSLEEALARIGSCSASLWATLMIGPREVVLDCCAAADKARQEWIRDKKMDTEQVLLQLLWARGSVPMMATIPHHIRNIWGLSQQPELVQTLAEPRARQHRHVHLFANSPPHSSRS
jgi:hypothetical protein